MTSPDDKPHIDMPQVPCPWCDETIAYCTLEKGDDPTRPPQPGDPMVCTSCAMVMIWSAVGNPRRPLEHEWARLNTDQFVTDTRKDAFMQAARGRGWTSESF